MLGKSASVGEVAKTVGLTRQTVYRIKDDPAAAEGIVEHEVAYQFVGALAHTEIVEQPARFQSRDRLRTHHAAIGDNANPTDREPLSESAPSLQPHYTAFVTTTGCSAPSPRFGTLALAVGAACGLSLGIGEQVLTFHTKAWSSFAPPTCRMPLRPSQASPELIQRKGHPPVLTSSNQLSTFHRRFACARLSRPCLPGSSSRRFRNAHHRDI
jgi:hypothetical protein